MTTLEHLQALRDRIARRAMADWSNSKRPTVPVWQRDGASYRCGAYDLVLSEIDTQTAEARAEEEG